MRRLSCPTPPAPRHAAILPPGQASGGQSLVEFALILPALILLVFGGVQLLLMVRADSAVGHLAQQDAQTIAVTGDCAAACLAALTTTAGLNPAALLVEVSAHTGDTVHPLPAVWGDTIAVAASYRYSFDVPLLGHLDRQITTVASVTALTHPAAP